MKQFRWHALYREDFIAIDTGRSLNDAIWDVYLIDAAAQVIFIAGWLVVIFIYRTELNKGKEYV